MNPEIAKLWHRPPPPHSPATQRAQLDVAIADAMREAAGEKPMTPSEAREVYQRSAHDSERPARFDAARVKATVLIENVKTLAAELLELVVMLDGGKPEHAKVDVRALLGRLRLAEVELDAAVVEMARQMGLTAEEAAPGIRKSPPSNTFPPTQAARPGRGAPACPPPTR
jgi:hypothetical protein